MTKYFFDHEFSRIRIFQFARFVRFVIQLFTENRRGFAALGLSGQLFAVALTGSIFCFSAAASVDATKGAGPARTYPNIVVFTVDDMDVTSVNCYGNPLPNLTPNMDRLASQGMRFMNAHVNSPICQPCRQSMMTGLQPHSNGSFGFIEVEEGAYPSLSGILMEGGYYTASAGKGRDYKAFPWDEFIEHYGWDEWYGRKPSAFAATAKKVIGNARAEGKPFYLGINTADPHRPWPGNEQEKEFVAWVRKDWPDATDYPKMDLVCSEEDVPLLPYLPDLPDIRKETVQYLTCVKRADDSLGAVMKVIEEEGLTDNTLFIFFSDHDAPMPTAKHNCYAHSSVTPLMIRWPGKIKPGSVDSDHMVSTLDLMPTLLEATGLPIPVKQDGRSMLSILEGGRQERRDAVFTTYNYITPGQQVFPMRAVHTKEWSYVFNPWSDGVKMRLQENGNPTENQSGLTFAAMQKAALTDPAMAERVDYILHRSRDEIFDLRKDPYSFDNLAENPEFATQLRQMKQLISDEMKRSGDPLIDAFENNTRYPAEWDKR